MGLLDFLGHPAFRRRFATGASRFVLATSSMGVVAWAGFAAWRKTQGVGHLYLPQRGAFANIEGSNLDGSPVWGYVEFFQHETHPTMITGYICGLSDGYHGLRIHDKPPYEKGEHVTFAEKMATNMYNPPRKTKRMKEAKHQELMNLVTTGRNNKANNAGDVFNPTNALSHGLPEDGKRQAGDLGNVYSKGGVAYINDANELLHVLGPYSIRDKAVVVTLGKDDGGKTRFSASKSSGNAGPGVAYGRIHAKAWEPNQNEHGVLLGV